MALDKLKRIFSSSIEPMEDEYIEIDLEQEKGRENKVLVKLFVLRQYEDVNQILNALRDGYTIAIIDFRILKQKDPIELKRAVSKIKKTIATHLRDAFLPSLKEKIKGREKIIAESETIKKTVQFSHIKPNTVVTAAKTAPKPKQAKKNTVGEIISTMKRSAAITAHVSQFSNIFTSFFSHFFGHKDNLYFIIISLTNQSHLVYIRKINLKEAAT